MAQARGQLLRKLVFHLASLLLDKLGDVSENEDLPLRVPECDTPDLDLENSLVLFENRGVLAVVQNNARQRLKVAREFCILPRQMLQADKFSSSAFTLSICDRKEAVLLKDGDATVFFGSQLV